MITFAKIQKISKEVIQEAFDGLDEKNLRSTMKNIIGKEVDKLILSLLGLERSWSSGIQVKYGGDFARQSDVISEEHIRELGGKFLTEILDAENIVLTVKEKNSLRKDFRERYMEVAEERIRYLATQKAKLDAETLFNEFLEEQNEKEEAEKLALENPQEV